MRVLVDADSCPVVPEVLQLAERLGAGVVLVCDDAHAFELRGGAELVCADGAPDAADIILANRAAPGDVVVTHDCGLAALALSRGAKALSPRGQEFTSRCMAVLLEQRHMAAKLRRAGVCSGGPKRFSGADRRRFRARLAALLREPRRQPTIPRSREASHERR